MEVTTEADAIVVGGGLVGLASAAFLARHGVATVLVERHAETSIHPKARLVTVRSMELYRTLGLEQVIRAAGEPSNGFAVAETLSSDLSTWITPPADEVEANGLSPTTPYSCDQQRLEPILLEAAKGFGAKLHFDTAVSDIADGPETIDVRMQGPDGERTIRGRYLVAADGARSLLRERLGVGMSGTEVPGRSISVLFQADLGPALQGRRVDAVFCRTAGAFLFARGNPTKRRWQLGTYMRPEWDGRAPGDLSTELIDVLRTATGIAKLRPTLEDAAIWSTGAFVADRFRMGRVLLAGDAAHVMPPYGGLGGNTGVQDAYDLAWKLAAVVRGEAPDRLLDSYATERARLDRMIVNQALLRSRKVPGQGRTEGEVDALRLSLGFRYGAEGFDDPAAPSMQSGTRAPHIHLADGRSILDRLDPSRFTAIVPEGTDLADARIRVLALAPSDIDVQHAARWTTTYGSAFGFLVRPDGVLAGAIHSPAQVGRLVDRALLISSGDTDVQ